VGWDAARHPILIIIRNDLNTSPHPASTEFSKTFPPRPGQHATRQRDAERLRLWAWAAFADSGRHKPRSLGTARQLHRQRPTQGPQHAHGLWGRLQKFDHLGRVQHGLQLRAKSRRLMLARDHQPPEFARKCDCTRPAALPPWRRRPRRHPPQPPGPKPQQQPLNPAEGPANPAIQHHGKRRLHPPRPQDRQNPAQDQPQIRGDRLMR